MGALTIATAPPWNGAYCALAARLATYRDSFKDEVPYRGLTCETEGDVEGLYREYGRNAEQARPAGAPRNRQREEVGPGVVEAIWERAGSKAHSQVQVRMPPTGQAQATPSVPTAGYESSHPRRGPARTAEHEALDHDLEQGRGERQAAAALRTARGDVEGEGPGKVEELPGSATRAARVPQLDGLDSRRAEVLKQGSGWGSRPESWWILGKPGLVSVASGP